MLLVNRKGAPAGLTINGLYVQATLQQRESIDIVQAILEAHLR